MEKKTISISPPDISKLEIAEVAEVHRSRWVTTGTRTKSLERRLAASFANTTKFLRLLKKEESIYIC